MRSEGYIYRWAWWYSSRRFLSASVLLIGVLAPWSHFVVLAERCNTYVIPTCDSLRGGASAKSRRSKDDTGTSYRVLARAIQHRFDGGTVEISALEKALASLSSAQQALKGLDGAAHEAYQRTHQESSVDTAVSGRARRSAIRAGSAADALLSAELCELLENPQLLGDNTENSTMAERQVLVNITNVRMTKDHNVTVLVLYEPSYAGGVGLDHGGVEDLEKSTGRYRKERGRVLVVVGDRLVTDLPKTMAVLDSPPFAVGLRSGLIANEIASVQGTLYRTAGRLLQEIEPAIRMNNESALHFVGRSLGGAVAGLSATILDGSLPMPESKRSSKLKKRTPKLNETSDASNVAEASLDGYGRGRSSASILGVPPCLSGNVKAPFVKSIIYGDDVVCRTTQESLDRLCSRTQKALNGGFLGKRVGWMTDTLSITVSSLRSHAHGSEGEEERLVIPGQAFLIRPRRLGGMCSIHEVGASKGGREALRAAVLWQLHDVVLSKSLWKHHRLDSYIHGLDRLQLRGFEDADVQDTYY